LLLLLLLFAVTSLFRASSLVNKKAKTHGRQSATTSECKILLSGFNTWKQVHPERENGSRLPHGKAADWFSAMISRHGSHIALPLRHKGNTIQA